MAVLKLSPKMKTISIGDDGPSEDGRAAAKAAFEDILKKLYHLGGPFFVMDFGNEGAVTLEVKPFEDKIHLSFITVPEEYRGKGLASKALRYLTDIADKHGVPIDLSVSPQGKGGFTKAQLFKWYERHGFKRMPYLMDKKLSDRMERGPREHGLKEATEILKVARELISEETISSEEIQRAKQLAKQVSRTLTQSDAVEWSSTIWQNGRFNDMAWDRYLRKTMERAGLSWDILEIKTSNPGTFTDISNRIFSRLERLLDAWKRQQAEAEGKYVEGQRYKWHLKLVEVDYWTEEEPWEAFAGGAAMVDKDGRKFEIDKFSGQVAMGHTLELNKWYTVSAIFDYERGGAIHLRNVRFGTG